MSELADKKCVPCVSGAKPLEGKQLQTVFSQLEEGWELVEGKKLKKAYAFKNFKEALHFVNQVGSTAEEEGHHPDLFLSWGKVVISLCTHKIKGLTESDFVLAAKCDVHYLSMKK